MEMLTESYIISNWEREWNDSIYFTFTDEGDCILYSLTTEQFYMENVPISEKEVCLLLGI